MLERNDMHDGDSEDAEITEYSSQLKEITKFAPWRSPNRQNGAVVPAILLNSLSVILGNA